MGLSFPSRTEDAFVVEFGLWIVELAARCARAGARGRRRGARPAAHPAARARGGRGARAPSQLVDGEPDPSAVIGDFHGGARAVVHLNVDVVAGHQAYDTATRGDLLARGATPDERLRIDVSILEQV